MDYIKLINEFTKSVSNSFIKFYDTVNISYDKVKLLDKPCIFVVGLRGAGKSSLCNLLTDKINWENKYPVSDTQNSFYKIDNNNNYKLLNNQYYVVDTDGYDNSVDLAYWFAEFFIKLLSIKQMYCILFVIPFDKTSDNNYVNLMKVLNIFLANIPLKNKFLIITKANEKYLYNKKETENLIKENIEKNVTYADICKTVGIDISNYENYNEKIVYIDNPIPIKSLIPNRSDEIIRILSYIKIIKLLGLYDDFILNNNNIDINDEYENLKKNVEKNNVIFSEYKNVKIINEDNNITKYEKVKYYCRQFWENKETIAILIGGSVIAIISSILYILLIIVSKNE